MTFQRPLDGGPLGPRRERNEEESHAELGDPLRYGCPKCKADPDEPCCRPSGAELDEPHKARRDVAAQELAAARRRAEGGATERIEGVRFRRLYTAAHMELEQRGDLTRLAKEQLEALVRNMESADKARAGAATEPLVEGSQGQKVANPLHALALRYDAQALAIARALKLTPDTRGHAAPADDAGNDNAPESPEDDPLDELARLDELAQRRKAKAAGGKRGR